MGTAGTTDVGDRGPAGAADAAGAAGEGGWDAPIEQVTIVGRGALGLLFAELIEAGLGEGSVRFLVSDERARAYAARPEPTINGRPSCFPVVGASQATPADLVIVCVKSPALAEVVDVMAGAVGPRTRLVSFMNGITSEEVLAARYGWERTALSIVQGMDAAYIAGALTYSHVGEVRLGAAPGTAPGVVGSIAALLARCGISHVVEADIRHRLWVKFMLNVGINQTCMAYGGTYGSVTDPAGEQYRCFLAAMREAQVVARAEGVIIDEDDFRAMATIATTLDPAGMPSMAQDRVNQNPSEVELFSGTIMRLAEEHGILVPTNRWLHERIRAIEAAYPPR